MEDQIRRASADDADAVVRMHTLAHEECYGHLLPPAFFEARRASMRERVERRRLHLDRDQPRIVALDANDEIVGFADAGPGRDEERPQALELYSLYTLKERFGEEFQQYRDTVRCWIPKVSKTQRSQRFRGRY